MNNPLMQMMGGGGMPGIGGMNMNAINQIKNMMNMFRGAANPQQMIMQMAQQNPQVSSLLQMCQGRNPKDVFDEQCRQHGLDPNNVAQQLGLTSNGNFQNNTSVNQ